jgi:biofilm PGA synthesis protein PgaD
VVLTATLWLSYVYLCADFFLFLGEALFWMLGLGLGPEPPRLQLIVNVLPTIATYAIIAIANAMLLIAWALYNQVRFRGRERRKTSPFVTVDDFARMYEVSASEVTAWQSARILVMHHDDNGRLVRVDLPEEAHATGGEPHRQDAGLPIQATNTILPK